MQRIALQGSHPMTASNARRGRPKGSGINDQQRLDEIARLIGSNPRLKPTTAIKAIGITDPSTIRRLRDKFNVEHSGGYSSSLRASRYISSARAAPLSAPEPTRKANPSSRVPISKSTDVKPIQPTSDLATAVTSKAANTNQVPVAAMLFGFGLNAATALFEQQMMIAQSVMKLPQVRDLFRQQIAFTEFMLTVANPSPGSRSVH
jgi:hypothetical protein